MQAQNLSKSALQLETERQNRIYRDAIEQKKKQMRPEEGGSARQVSEKRNPDIAPSPADTHSDTSEPSDVPTDRLRHIPDMRSALIPLDEATEERIWSKPFSLPKADIEPWLSYCKGYWQSKLFLETFSGLKPMTGDGFELPVDFAVRALLELKQLDINIILEPRVRIDGHVEYLELDDELRVCHDSAQIKALVARANEGHDKLLRKAFEIGRQMGNRLYDALMGDGHVHLIAAWESVHGRKPTVEELHRMLTTGRIRELQREKDRAPEIQNESLLKENVAPVMPEERSSGEALPLKSQPPPVDPPPVVGCEDNDALPVQAPEDDPVNRKRRILFHVIHITAVCAVLVAYGIWVLI
ncbi:MAG TPA: hypothetical protein VJ654_07975 [Noviherbaspirillum sp.]|nr:hypothetical protein [Noviherbaspirillum sp.]